jgi:hypothetical protein
MCRQVDDQLAAMVPLWDEGKIGTLGLSGVTLNRLCRAIPAGIAGVQGDLGIGDYSCLRETTCCPVSAMSPSLVHWPHAPPPTLAFRCSGVPSMRSAGW